MMTTPFNSIIDEVRVLLVDHDKENVTEMVGLLKSYKYKVTTVDMALVGMSVLSKGKEKIDVMIISIHSPDSLCFKLLKQVVALNIVSVVVCDEYNELFAKRAFDDGAFLYLKRPLDKKIVKCLWQFVLSKKIQREKARKEYRDPMKIIDDIGNNNMVGDKKQIGEKNIPIHIKEERKNTYEAETNVISNGEYNLWRKRARQNTKEINEGEGKIKANNVTVTRKDCIEWTKNLHGKFLEATQQLGEKSCLPKKIVKEMNVPGLTKNQVSSHLQMHLNKKWRPPEEQKYIRQESLSDCQQKRNFIELGRTPHIQTNVPNQTPKVREFHPINTNNIIASSTQQQQQQQLYRPQLPAQPHYLNPFLSAQNNVGGEVQKYGPLFGSQEPIIGGTNYRPGLGFNSWDHHGYNMDVNAGHVPTYSGIPMMFDKNIENTTINRLGEITTDFQQSVCEQNMSGPNNIVATSNAIDIEGNDSTEKEDCDLYFNYNDYLKSFSCEEDKEDK